MKTTLLLSIALLATSIAMADVNYHMAIDQAKRAANSSGPSIPQQSPPAAAPQQPPENPQLAATMKNISDLHADITALTKAEDAAAADNERIPLLNHLSAAAQGTKASSDSVKKLADDLITAISRKHIPDGQQTILARYLHAFFNASHLSATQQETLLKSAHKILTDAGTPEDETGKVEEDLKGIAAETK